VNRNEPSLALAIRALLAGLVLCQAGSASASTFSVNPTQVFLSAKVTSALVTIKNESAEALRFQLSVVAWEQTPDGEMKLAPTQDMVLFPQLLRLAPGEERRVRVGTMLAPGPVERTYRLFIEELPPSEGETKTGTVRVLTKMGIPIFLRSADAPAVAELSGLAVKGGRLAFTIANKGTTHFVPNRILVRALGAAGDVVGEQDQKAWYILAHSERVFDIELPTTPLSAVVVEVTVPGLKAPLVERVPVQSDTPGRHES
jgi:fimbrial chaperone protein